MSRGKKFQQSHSQAQTRLFRTSPPLWNLTSAGYPKCIPVDSPVPVQQADAQLDGSPFKSIAGSMGAGLFPHRAFFFSRISTDFCLAVLVSSPYARLAFFVTYPPGRPSRRLPAPLGISDP